MVWQEKAIKQILAYHCTRTPNILHNHKTILHRPMCTIYTNRTNNICKSICEQHGQKEWNREKCGKEQWMKPVNLFLGKCLHKSDVAFHFSEYHSSPHVSIHHEYCVSFICWTHAKPDWKQWITSKSKSKTKCIHTHKWNIDCKSDSQVYVLYTLHCMQYKRNKNMEWQILKFDLVAMQWKGFGMQYTEKIPS